MSKAIKGALFAALAATVGAGAMAATANDQVIVRGEAHGVTRTVVVSLAGLNLAEDSEVARATTRLRFASKQVCGAGADVELYNKVDYRSTLR